MKKRLLALTLALVLAVGLLAACSGGGDGRSFVAVPAGPWDTPYDTTVKVTAVATQGANWHFEGDDDINNNPWTRLYKEKLNIEVSFDWTVTDEYETRLNMAIAAGDLPDTFYIPASHDPRQFRDLHAEGMLLDLTDAYNNYASQRIRDFEKTDPDTIKGYTIDGKIFGLPRYYYGQIDQPWHLWVRKDWYEAEGSPEIKTVEDYENLARAFMNNHGAAYGIAVDENMQWLIRGTGSMFGAYNGDFHNNSYFWRPDSTGRIRPDVSFPEFQTALEYWAKWYEEGLISPEFPSLGEWGRGQEDINNGRVGIMTWWQWWGWYAGHTIVPLQGNDSYFIPLNIPTLDGAQPANGQIFYPNGGATVATKDFANPAALMKVISLIDFMVASPDAGLSDEDIRYYFDEGREHAMTPTFHMIDPNTDLVQYQHVLHAIETGDTSDLFTPVMKFKYNDSRSWINDQNPPGLGAYLQMGFDGSAYARSQHLFDIGRIVRTSMWGPPPPEFADAGSTGDVLMEGIMAIVMGNRPTSDWPSILEQWYAGGGQIKEDAVNKHFG